MTRAIESVSMIGLGYIGLPTAAMLASRKLKVVGVDVNTYVVDTINRGEIHIVEPELDIIVKAAVAQGFLRAAVKPEPADVFLIAVPTPFRANHEPDLSFVEAAARSIAPVLRAGNLVILESTSPVGTTEQVSNWLARERADLSFPHQKGEASDIRIAYCPERVLPGRVVHELVSNDRVIGGMTSRCSARATELYRTFVNAECIPTSARTAEMCKLTENSFRDVNIAFANELSVICDKLDIDVWELIELANRHPRVKILQPGPGVGGHCIAVDPWFIVSSAPEEARLIHAARLVNDEKPGFVVRRIAAAASKFRQPVVACLGLAFKPDIDDLRESPAMEVVHMLADERIGRLLVVEPHIDKLPRGLSADDGIELVSPAEALRRADVVVMLVNHKEFLSIDRALLAGKALVDTRGVWR